MENAKRVANFFLPGWQSDNSNSVLGYSVEVVLADSSNATSMRGPGDWYEWKVQRDIAGSSCRCIIMLFMLQLCFYAISVSSLLFMFIYQFSDGPNAYVM